MRRPYLTREWLIEDARAAVLAGLDAFVRTSGLPLADGQLGAGDADLPDLFRGIDAQVDRLIARSGVILPDRPYQAAPVDQTRIALALALANHAQVRAQG